MIARRSAVGTRAPLRHIHLAEKPDDRGQRTHVFITLGNSQNPTEDALGRPTGRTAARICVGLLSATLVAVPAVVAFSGSGPQETAFCPLRKSVVLSAGEDNLHAWLRRDDPANPLIHLCWADNHGRDAVQRWTGTARDTTDRYAEARLHILPLTPHTALGTVALPPGHTWRLSFQLSTDHGTRAPFVMTIRS